MIASKSFYHKNPMNHYHHLGQKKLLKTINLIAKIALNKIAKIALNLIAKIALNLIAKTPLSSFRVKKLLKTINLIAKIALNLPQASLFR